MKWILRLKRAVCAAIGVLGLCCVAGAAVAAEALDTEKFIDSIGVNTHVNYTDGAYADVGNVGDHLKWLGVRHVRDATPGHTAPISAYAYLGQRGIKFDFIVQDELNRAFKQLIAVHDASPGIVAAVEGFNEIDNWPVTYAGLKGNAAGLAAQQDIYRFVRGERRFKGVPVYDLTGFDVKPVSTRAGSADYVNLHLYTQNGEQPDYNSNGDIWLKWGLSILQKFNLPIVITEFGYFTIPQSGWNLLGVDEPTQAKGVLNGLLDASNAGVARTYVYELLDEKPDPENADAGMHFGLFRNDHTAKPSAVALRNLIAILRATGKPSVNRSEKGQMAVRLADLPVSGRSLLLQKQDGKFALALWNEVPFWDRAGGKPLNSPPARVVVDFGKTARVVNLYDPLVGTAPLFTQRNVSEMTVEVPDHPVLVEVTFPD